MKQKKPTKVISDFKKILASGIKTNSEVFRRIYKLPVKLPKNLSSVIENTVDALNEKHTSITLDDANAIYTNWNAGLEYFEKNRYNEIMQSIETVFSHENAEIIFGDWKQWENASIEKSDAMQELKQIEMGFICTPMQIESEYNEAVKTVDREYNLRKDIVKSVFGGNGGRFRAFMNSRNKRDYLTLTELRKLDRLASDSFGADWVHLVDSLEQMHTKESYTKRIKELRQIKKNKIEEYNEMVSRKLFLKSVIEK